jgi:asparagine synthase (glutamine-hydrolysing)
LRSSLKDWGESLIGSDRLAKDGLLKGDLVRAAWQDHLAGKRDFTGRLWCVLMFQAWLDHHVPVGVT